MTTNFVIHCMNYTTPTLGLVMAEISYKSVIITFSTRIKVAKVFQIIVNRRISEVKLVLEEIR